MTFFLPPILFFLAVVLSVIMSKYLGKIIVCTCDFEIAKNEYLANFGEIYRIKYMQAKKKLTGMLICLFFLVLSICGFTAGVIFTLIKLQQESI